MRPPRGYDSNDKPLPHKFSYKFGLTVHASNKAKTMVTYLRTSKDSVDPATIEVHRKNASFAEDTGPCICYDSMIPQIQIIKNYQFDFGGMETAKLPSVLMRDMKIFGHHADCWTPADPLSGSTIATTFEVTSDTTKEDVVPTPTGTDLNDVGTQPLSTVTMAEAYTDYNLTTDADLEAVNQIIGPLRTVERYKTIANKAKSIRGRINSHRFSRQRPHYSSYELRASPKQVRFADEHLFYGEFIEAPDKANADQILNPAITTTDISHLYCKIDVEFMEWNKDFDQRRM